LRHELTQSNLLASGDKEDNKGDKWGKKHKKPSREPDFLPSSASLQPELMARRYAHV
jgi:hypothetical protein